MAVDPIEHVIVLMLENLSFDHMLGVFQQVYADLDGIPSEGILAAGRVSQSVYCSCIQSGIPVVSTAAGAEALERLRSEQRDVIVCDLDLPDMGFEKLLRAVQTRSPTAAFVLCVHPNKLREAMLGTRLRSRCAYPHT